MRYVVKVTCFYDNRYYKKGETAEFPSAVTPPEYFELIDKVPDKATEKPAEKKLEKPIEQPKVEIDEPKKDEPKKSRIARAKAKKNG